MVLTGFEASETCNKACSHSFYQVSLEQHQKNPHKRCE